MAIPLNGERPSERPDDRLTPSRLGLLAWKRTTVDGRVAYYGEGGDGLPVLFLHGWAAGHHSYKPALKRLIALGCHVWAPALPAFGGTPEVPGSQLSFPGYAGWLERFCDAAGVTEPVVVVGHSFGGGVGTQFTHDAPDRVRRLVLINSVGGSTWLAARPAEARTQGATVTPITAAAGGRSMSERPLWDWGRHFPSDVLAISQLGRMVPVFLEDTLPNVVRNPFALWKVGMLARKADLAAELRDLRARQVPVTVVWSERDEIIPRASFDDICSALGVEGEVIAGAHTWLLADPDAFAALMAQVLELGDEDPQSADPPAAG